MGRYIIKLDDYYLEWSTVSDAPTTWGMKLDEFEVYYHDQYGLDGMADLPKRLERVEKKGTSAFDDDSVADTLFCNRAGGQEKTLSRAEIIEWYCVKRMRVPDDVGVELEFDEDGEVLNHPDID